jgi:hypothetical protein
MITDNSFRIFRIRTAFRLLGFAFGINFYFFGLIFFRTGIPAIICIYIHFGERSSLARCCPYRFRVSVLPGFRLLFSCELFTFFAFPGREIYIVEEFFLRHSAQRQRKHDR